MTVTRRRLIVGGAIALAFVASITVAAVAQHRAAQELQASIEALDPLREECREARAEMQAEQGTAQEALDATTLLQDIAEVESLTETIHEASTLERCDMGPGDSVEANEDFAAWLGDTRLDAELIQEALVGGQEALALAEAEAATAQAAAQYDEEVSAAEAELDEARAALRSAEGEVADDDTTDALKAAIGAIESVLATEPPADADAQWFDDQSASLADVRGPLAGAVKAVESSHEAWKEAQAAARSAASSGSGSGSSSSSGSSSGSGSGSGATSSVTYAKGSAADFCAALNSARTSNGVAAFSSCGESSSQVAHAQDMARSGSIWHTGGENIVGYAGSMSSLMSAFMGSSQHRDLILTGGSPASVGCYWRHESRTSQVFCSAAFSF